MLDALKNNVKLEVAYTVNGIIYALKQIPLVKKILPSKLYSCSGLKIFALIVMLFIRFVEVFLYKVLYIFPLIFIPVSTFNEIHGEANSSSFFLHILFFMTLIGTFINSNLFEASRHRYYAVILMRMNARDHTIAHYSVYLVKLVVGFLAILMIFGGLCGVPIWMRLVLPFGIAGCKLLYNTWTLYRFSRKNGDYDLKKSGQKVIALVVLAAAAYIPCLIGFPLPSYVTIALFGIAAIGGVFGYVYMTRYNLYRPIYQQTLTDSAVDRKDLALKTRKQNVEKSISADTNITSNKEGFEFLNDLFVKRHKKLLWKTTMFISAGCLAVAAIMFVIILAFPDSRSTFKSVPLKGLPYLTFIMYFLNRGTGITQALFMNCDHSLLTYSVYKQRSNILKLFRIRLREIIKINIVPALIIGVSLAVMLALCGGSGDPLDYIILLISVPCISIFFSVHYLTIYYLLQPFNAGTEMKSGMYTFITSATYFACYMLMQCRFPTHIFGLITIIFSLLYCVIACLLVYRFAPKSFRIRN